MRLFVEPNVHDEHALKLFYTQAIHDVISGRYRFSEQDLISLAALRLHERYDN